MLHSLHTCKTMHDRNTSKQQLAHVKPKPGQLLPPLWPIMSSHARSHAGGEAARSLHLLSEPLVFTNTMHELTCSDDIQRARISTWPPSFIFSSRRCPGAKSIAVRRANHCAAPELGAPAVSFMCLRGGCWEVLASTKTTTQRHPSALCRETDLWAVVDSNYNQDVAAMRIYRTQPSGRYSPLKIVAYTVIRLYAENQNPCTMRASCVHRRWHPWARFGMKHAGSDPRGFLWSMHSNPPACVVSVRS